MAAFGQKLPAFIEKRTLKNRHRNFVLGDPMPKNLVGPFPRIGATLRANPWQRDLRLRTTGVHVPTSGSGRPVPGRNSPAPKAPNSRAGRARTGPPIRRRYPPVLGIRSGLPREARPQKPLNQRLPGTTEGRPPHLRPEPHKGPNSPAADPRPEPGPKERKEYSTCLPIPKNGVERHLIRAGPQTPSETPCLGVRIRPVPRAPGRALGPCFRKGLWNPGSPQWDF